MFLLKVIQMEVSSESSAKSWIKENKGEWKNGPAAHRLTEQGMNQTTKNTNCMHKNCLREQQQQQQRKHKPGSPSSDISWRCPWNLLEDDKKAPFFLAFLFVRWE